MNSEIKNLLLLFNRLDELLRDFKIHDEKILLQILIENKDELSNLEKNFFNLADFIERKYLSKIL